ncbi:hypothetical protein CF336_g9554, partial [Tilletia laevis]
FGASDALEPLINSSFALTSLPRPFPPLNRRLLLLHHHILTHATSAQQQHQHNSSKVTQQSSNYTTRCMLPNLIRGRYQTLILNIALLSVRVAPTWEWAMRAGCEDSHTTCSKVSMTYLFRVGLRFLQSSSPSQSATVYGGRFKTRGLGGYLLEGGGVSVD